MKPKVGVVGLGVGYALACCLAEAGYDTIGVDISANVVANPRIDPSLKKLVEHDDRNRRNISSHLNLSTDYGKLSNCGYVTICVSTGDEKKLVLGHVEEAVHSCCKVMKSGATMIVYSTLPFGASKKAKTIIEANRLKCDDDIRYVHMPLMISQGTTADDFVNPPFVAFGSYSRRSATDVLQFYKEFIIHSSLWKKQLPPMFVTSPETAELAKLTANAFLAMKMSFANMTDVLCKKTGIDSIELLEIVGSDWRIGKKMLRAGYAWGGNCFPRDMQSLVETYAQNDIDASILRASLELNESRLVEPYRILQSKRIDHGPVLILGLAYKSGMNITSGSKSVQLLEYLHEKGYDAVAYDPNINPDDEREISERLYRAIIVTTDEPCFDSIIEKVKKGSPRLEVFDYRMRSRSA
jgi:UDPglucose 6-dehydrogenase